MLDDVPAEFENPAQLRELDLVAADRKFTWKRRVICLGS